MFFELVYNGNGLIRVPRGEHTFIEADRASRSMWHFSFAVLYKTFQCSFLTCLQPLGLQLGSSLAPASLGSPRQRGFSTQGPHALSKRCQECARITNYVVRSLRRLWLGCIYERLVSPVMRRDSLSCQKAVSHRQTIRFSLKCFAACE